MTLGDGAGYAWLMSEERANCEQRRSLGVVAGWGVSCDANHMTGPARDSAGLSRAIHAALARAGRDPASIGSICAHGTGTRYNDTMEMHAFRKLLGDAPVRNQQAHLEQHVVAAPHLGDDDGDFRKLLGDAPVPSYSIKGSIGHTLGAAGLIELAVSLRSLQEGIVPASAGLREPDDDADGWVFPTPISNPDLSTVLSTNSGFGGINAALLLANA